VVPQATAEEAARMNDHLIIQPNTLVLYIDEAGDERLNNRTYPIFAFGGVACVTEFHPSIARAWQAMKALTFPQVIGPLHAKTHLRDRLVEPKRLAVLGGMAHQQLGRFGTVITTLIKKGMIYSPSHGDTAFTVPLFDQYMRRVMPRRR
jgi:hypothetical protein